MKTNFKPVTNSHEMACFWMRPIPAESYSLCSYHGVHLCRVYDSGMIRRASAEDVATACAMGF